RWSASIDVAPQIGQRTWERVSWPGAKFTIRTGYRYGPGDREWLTFGEYVHDRYPSQPYGDVISLSLTDRWTQLEKARFDEPTTPNAAPRTTVVQKLIGQAFGPNQAVSVRTSGGSTSGEAEFSERDAAIEKLAKDGGFVAYFDYDGTFVIGEPAEVSASVATFTIGQSGSNIKELTRGGGQMRLYNHVVVYPADRDKHDFTTQTATLDEPHHPLDPHNQDADNPKGLIVPYKHASPSITNSTDA